MTNYIPTNGNTVRWHGIRQLHTDEAVGFNGVTQCPIANGDEYTYNFRAIQYEPSWYHSHYSLQYPDGVAAPLLVHGPSIANWDEAWDPILICDWSHNSALADVQGELSGHLQVMQTVVLDGTGTLKSISSCDTTLGLSLLSATAARFGDLPRTMKLFSFVRAVIGCRKMH